MIAFDTTRFGRIEVPEDRLIRLTRGILGFPKQKDYVLIPHRENSPFHWLQSVDNADLAFVVASPARFFTDYVFDVPDAIQKELGIERVEQVEVLVIVTVPPDDPKGMTVNLLGPLVVNAERRVGSQVVLDPNTYPVKFRLFPDAKPSQGQKAGAEGAHTSHHGAVRKVCP